MANRILFLAVWTVLALQVPRGAEALGRKASQREVLRVVEGEHLRAHQTPTVVTHTSWFSRLGNSLFAVLLGLFAVIPFSMSCLWVNERRNAETEVVLSLGKQEAETIEADQPDLPDYDGSLVHLNSESALGMEPVQDERFAAVYMQSGCLRLRTSVEVYQWEEKEHEQTKKDSIGGGETKVTTYTYEKSWSSSSSDSSGFKQGGHENSVHVKGMPLGQKDVVNGLVKYGEAYQMPTNLVEQLNNWEDAQSMVGGAVKFANYTFERQDNWYKCPAHGGEPEIGDVRVSFTCVLNGPATIMALQMNSKQTGSRSFGPYRSVPHGMLCGAREDELKLKRVRAAEKDAGDIYNDQKCDSGPFSCLCCYCNLVTLFFASALVPQIYSAWSGHMSKGTCFDSEEASAKAQKWGFRLLGWVVLWIGFTMLFAPLTTILDIIPFLGPYISSGATWVIGIFTFVLTLAAAFLIISLAYMVYHPLIGLAYLAVTGGIIGAIMFLSGSHAAAA